MAVTAVNGSKGNLSEIELSSYRVLNDGTVALAMCNPDGTALNSVLNSTITSTSANALVVGPNGATNPTFNIDASTASAATGVNVKSAAAAGGVAVSVLSSGTDENLTIDAKGAGTITLNGTATGAVLTGHHLNVTSSNANAFAVGQNGTTNPALQVDASTSTSATGVKVKSAAAAGGVAVSTISSGTNENLTVDAKGSGTVTINGTGTGNTVVGHNLAVTGTTVGTSASATSLAVGLNGSTNPAFVVDSSTASQAAGLKVTGAATGGTVAVAAVDSGTNTNLSVNAKGSGTVVIAGTSTGQVSIGRGAVGAPIFSSTIGSLGTTQNSTPTAANLLGGVVTQTGATGAGTVTLPTGTQLSTAVTGVAVGDTFQCVFANLGGGQTLTITGATGSTVIGTAAISSGKNALMTFVNTGANTWNVYVNASA